VLSLGVLALTVVLGRAAPPRPAPLERHGVPYRVSFRSELLNRHGGIRLGVPSVTHIGWGRIAAAAPWQRLSEARKLKQAEAPPGQRRLLGQLGGFTVQVEVQEDPPRSLVSVELPPLEPAMDISLGPGGLTFGNPVLDGVLRVEAPDAERVRALLTCPAAAAQDLDGRLLAVLHGRPGSELRASRLQVVASTRSAAGVEALLDDADRLAVALFAAAPATA